MKHNMISVFLISLLIGAATISGQTPELQFIHNAAGPNTELVNAIVFLAGIPVLEVDNIAYKSTIPWTEGLAGISLQLDIELLDGTILIDDFPLTMEDNTNYLLIGQGVSDPGDYAPNPDGINTQADIALTDEARQVSATPGQIEALFIHGTTDLQTVDFRQGTGVLTGGMAYTDISSYIVLAPDVTTIDITDDSGTDVLYRFEADLSGYADSALVIFTTGFVDPAANQDGPVMTLCAISAGGTLIEFTPLGTDPPNIRYRPKTGFSVTATAGDICTQSLGIRNTGDEDLVWDYTIEADWLSGSITSGTVAPDGIQNSILSFDATGLATGTYRTRISINSNDPDNPAGRVPMVLTVIDPGWSVAVDYGPGTILAPQVTTTYDLDLTVNALACVGGTMQVKCIMTTPTGAIRSILDPPLQLNQMRGGSELVLHPQMVLNPDAGWYGVGTYVLDSWLIDPLSADTIDTYTSSFNVLATAESTAKGLEQALAGGLPQTHELAQNYPNPFNPTTTIRYGLSEDAEVSIKIYSALGQEIATLVNNYQTAGYQSVEWDGRDASGQQVGSGIYIYRLRAGDISISRTMQLIH